MKHPHTVAPSLLSFPKLPNLANPSLISLAQPEEPNTSRKEYFSNIEERECKAATCKI